MKAHSACLRLENPAHWLGRSFEPGSCVTDASDSHPEKQDSPLKRLPQNAKGSNCDTFVSVSNITDARDLYLENNGNKSLYKKRQSRTEPDPRLTLIGKPQ
jgi:hypothetical protein